MHGIGVDSSEESMEDCFRHCNWNKGGQITAFQGGLGRGVRRTFDIELDDSLYADNPKRSKRERHQDWRRLPERYYSYWDKHEILVAPGGSRSSVVVSSRLSPRVFFSEWGANRKGGFFLYGRRPQLEGPRLIEFLY